MVDSTRSNNHIVLNVQEISKSYGEVKALDGLSFEARAGEIIGLLGPNGAGKTTAIRILTTILPADRGHFSVIDIPDSRPGEIRALIGVLPESNGFPMHMTGLDYLVYMGRLYGRSKTQAKEKAVKLLRLFGLEKASGMRIATYSRGMKQRLATARSLINDPKILFLDEPTLGFDPKGQREMLQIIRDAAEVQETAVILSSHLLEVVESICDRVLILNRGRTVAAGSVADIKQRVALPHDCRIQMPAHAIPVAITELSTMTGVTVDRHANHTNELIVTIQGAKANGEMNAVLGRLIQKGIPIEGFSQDTARLSDAFLSMIEEVQA